VVDLWGGTADVSRERPWGRDTIACMNSATKGATVVCALLLTERGDLNLDAPIAEVWPEFAAQGKEVITLRMVMAHRAGLAHIEGFSPEKSGERDLVLAAIAAQAPNWEPGTAQGYHAASMGWIVGEVVRRVSGRTIGRLFADEVAAPLGLDLWIGLPEEEEFRYAPFVEFDPRMRAQLRARLAGRAGPASTGEYSAQHSLPARQSLRLCVRLSSGETGCWPHVVARAADQRGPPGS
jgi:CubicO group peptidase (beta-lactamase class C family)